MSYLSERWNNHKTDLQTFLGTFTGPNQYRDTVSTWLEDIIDATETNFEAGLGALEAAGQSIDAERKSKLLRAIHGAALKNIPNFKFRVSGAAGAGDFANAAGSALAQAQAFIRAFGDAEVVKGIRDAILRLIVSKNGVAPPNVYGLVDSMSRFILKRKGPPFTDPSSFWPSSYISSTSTSGGGFAVLCDSRPPKKPAGKKKAAAKKSVPKKKARNA